MSDKSEASLMLFNVAQTALRLGETLQQAANTVQTKEKAQSAQRQAQNGLRARIQGLKQRLALVDGEREVLVKQHERDQQQSKESIESLQHTVDVQAKDIQRLKKEKIREVVKQHERDQQRSKKSIESLQHAADLQTKHIQRLKNEKIRDAEKGAMALESARREGTRKILDQVQQERDEARDVIAQLEKDIIVKEGALCEALCRLKKEEADRRQAIQRLEKDCRKTVDEAKRRAEEEVDEAKRSARAQVERLQRDLQQANKDLDLIERQSPALGILQDEEPEEEEGERSSEEQSPASERIVEGARPSRSAAVKPRKGTFRRMSTLDKQQRQSVVELSSDSDGEVRTRKQKKVSPKPDLRNRALRALKKKRSAAKTTAVLLQASNSKTQLPTRKRAREDDDDSLTGSDYSSDLFVSDDYETSNSWDAICTAQAKTKRKTRYVPNV